MDTALPEGGTAPLREFINMRRGIYGDQTGPRTGTWARHIGEARALCAGHRPGHRRRRYHPGCPGHQNDWLLRMAGLLCGHYHGLLYDPAHRVRFRHGPPGRWQLLYAGGPCRAEHIRHLRLYVSDAVPVPVAVRLLGRRISGRHHSRAQQSWRPHRNRSGAADLLLCNQPDGH